jgi:hypothetical protein
MGTSLPRGPDTTRSRSVVGVVLIDGIERMTTALRRGDPFSESALDDMLTLRRRLEGFAAALESRLRTHGMAELLEQDDE